MSQNATHLGLKVPEDLHQSFKVWCASHKTTITAELIRHMEAVVQRSQVQAARDVYVKAFGPKEPSDV